MMVETQLSQAQTVYDFLVATPGRKSSKEISMATGISEGRLNGLMRDWFNGKGIGQVPFFHIHRAADGIRAMYWYDGAVLRTEGAVSLRKVSTAVKNRHPSAKKRNGVEVAPTPKAPAIDLELYARVLFDHEGVVVGITTNGRIFKGRWMREE